MWYDESEGTAVLSFPETPCPLWKAGQPILHRRKERKGMLTMFKKCLTWILALALCTTVFSGNRPVAAAAADSSGEQTFSENGNQVQIRLLSQEVVRLRVGPGGQFAADFSGDATIVKPDEDWEGAPDLDPDPDVVDTGKLKLVFSREPLTLTVYNADGQALLSNYTFDFSQSKAVWDLAPNEHLYGFGDRRGGLDKRGKVMDVWNSDTDYHTTPETGYKSVPMYWSSLGYGVYLHNWQPSTFNLGGTDAGKIQITASGGEMDFYLFGGPTFADIAGQYTALTGRPAMLPKWALGYHQGGAGNDPTLNWASGVASQMRQNQLPLDAVYYDDWDASYFTPAAVGSLKDQYHIQITAGLGMPYSAAGSDLWNALAQLSPKGMLCDADGTPLQYCANGFENPVTDFDFFNSAACDEIFNQVWKGPLDAGVWNGMSDFGELDYVPNPTQAFFPSFQNPARSAYELHNLYGLQYFMSMTQRAADYKDSRLIGMTRPGTAGSQRYGWTWTGDSDTNYDGVNGFQAHLRGVLNLTMSGFSNVGFDIGGWDGVSDDALFARWFQAGMFNPYAAAHGCGDHTIYGAHAAVMDVCRDALELRYSLLPYTYSLMYQAHQTGVPIQRTLAFETNCESGTEDLWDEFFYGPSLLAAPVVRDSTVKNVYLPSGTWIDYWDGKTAYSGRRRLEYSAPLDCIPLFVKAGAILPTGPAMQYTSQLENPPLTLDYYPAETLSTFTLFEDDGVHGYEDGNYATTQYTAQRTGDSVSFTLHSRETHGTYSQPPRSCTLKIHLLLPAEDYQVAVNGQPADPADWSYDSEAQLLTLNLTDDGSQKAVVVSSGQAKISRLPNAAGYLNTPSVYDADAADEPGQQVHPDVVRFDAPWNGYRYWMSTTPYPFTCEPKENPSILASNDGLTWVIPDGVSGVLAEAPANGHNCDTDLVYNPLTDELWMYYIRTDDCQLSDLGEDQLRVLKSADGVTWTDQLVFTSPKAYSILGQSVCYRADRQLFEMWYINSGENSRLEYRSSADGMHWSAPSFPYFDAEVSPWHVDVQYIPSRQEYWMLFPAAYNESVMDTAVYFAKSSDGLCWQTSRNAVLERGPAGSWDSSQIYRSTFLYDNASETLRVWYSANRKDPKGRGELWHIGYTQGRLDTEIPARLINVARGKYTEGDCEFGHPEQLATDDNLDTYWAAPFCPTSWRVYLQNVYDIQTVRVIPYHDGTRYYQYNIETSLDGVNWTRAAEKTDLSPATEAGDTYTLNVTARYLRINVLHNSANAGAHLCDVKVYGTPHAVPSPPVNVALNKTASALSSAEGHGASLAVDGDDATYWDGAPAPQSWQLDLEDNYDVTMVNLKTFADGTRYYHYTIEASRDGVSWTTVAQKTDDTPARTDGESYNVPMIARYFRVTLTENSANDSVHIREFQVYGLYSADQSSLLSAGITPTCSFAGAAGLERLTDGVTASEPYLDTTAGGLQWVQLDLGAEHEINTVFLWHYYADARTYHDVILQLSNDPNFSSGVSTLFSNDADNSAGQGYGFHPEYEETAAGQEIYCKNIRARYVRFYSNGSTVNDSNHYVEAQVYGR